MTKATSRNFNSSLRQSPISVVLFHQKPVSFSVDFLAKLEGKYEPDIKFYRVDDKKFMQSLGINFAYQIAIYRGTTLSDFYNGQWTFDAMDKFCDGLLNADFDYISNPIDLFRFQTKRPYNVLISDEKMIKKAPSILSYFGGIVNVGILSNFDVLKAYKLPAAQLCKPMEDMCYNITNISYETIAQFIKPHFIHQSNEYVIGEQVKEKYALVALLDENDPRHIHDTMENFRYVENFFGANVSLQSIDFFKAKKYIDQFSIISFNQPVYVYMERGPHGNMVNVYQKLLPGSEELLQWLKMLILSIQPDKDDSVIIPRLTAKDFIEKALNPAKDVILLVGSPKMKRYPEALHNFNVIAQVFAPFSDRIELYEFDITVEHVDGLSLPMSKDPQLSVWGASEDPDGSTFTALASVAVLLDNIVQMMKSEFTPDEFEQMATNLQQILGTS